MFVTEINSLVAPTGALESEVPPPSPPPPQPVSQAAPTNPRRSNGRMGLGIFFIRVVAIIFSLSRNKIGPPRSGISWVKTLEGIFHQPSHLPPARTLAQTQSSTGIVPSGQAVAPG